MFPSILWVWVFCSILRLAVPKEGSNVRFVSVIKASGDLKLIEGKEANAIVWGSFQDDIAKDGWSYLEIRTNPYFDDELAAYSAGVVEADLTRHLITPHLYNLFADYCKNNTEYCDKVMKYFQAQLEWMNERSREERSRSAFWNQVYLILKQLTGLDDAYRNSSLNAGNVYTTVNQLYFVNNEGALYDLESALGRRPDNGSLSSVTPCSMLIKKTPKDLLVGHTTWWVYRGMLRIQKRYSLNFRLTASSMMRVNGATISMPSYPAKLSSMDDFYVIASGLVVTETTNNIYNKTQYEFLSEETVPASFRAMAANRIALDGCHWTRQFQKHNSGTYNNQWIIINYKNIIRVGDTIVLRNGTFWMLEQLPTLVVSRDMTDVLVKQEYWASYNIPYFSQIYKESGYLDQFNKYGDRYSYDSCHRAKIFQRDQFRVKNVSSMIALLRFNDFKNDPLSRCNCTPPFSPVYAIAARYDLVDPDGKYDDTDIKLRAEGAIDAKVTDINSVADLTFYAICGPTSDQQPVFYWSKSAFSNRPLGHPDKFDFGTVRHSWTL